MCSINLAIFNLLRKKQKGLDGFIIVNQQTPKNVLVTYLKSWNRQQKTTINRYRDASSHLRSLIKLMTETKIFSNTLNTMLKYYDFFLIVFAQNYISKLANCFVRVIERTYVDKTFFESVHLLFVMLYAGNHNAMSIFTCAYV